MISVTLSEALKGQIKKSFAFLLFVGEDLVASEWALRELEVFFELYGEAARERLYVIAMSKPAMQALTALPRWTRLGLCDQLWLPFWDDSIPHLPIPIHAKKSRDVVVSNEFWERFVRLRDALADSIRRSHEEGVRAAAPAVAEARAAASGASNVLAVGSSETSSAAAGASLINATIFIESNRDERDEWEALGELLRERWPAQGGQAASLRLRVRGLPLDLMQDMNLLADADGVVLLWGRKPAQALVSQIDKLERQLPGADPCPGLVAHLSPPQPEADDALPAWGWRVVRFRLPAAERALVHEADAVDLDRFLARVAQHARARPAPSPG